MDPSAERSTFDLRSPDVRILECSHCDEPVLASFASRVTLRCDYCGFEDARELQAPRGSDKGESIYRSRVDGRRARKLRVDLGEKLEGLPRLNPLVAARALYLERKKAISAMAADRDDEQRAAVEFDLLHVAAFLSALHINGRDWLHARAVLETTLEAMTIPLYRALALTRLARVAAACGGPELAERWLSMCPTELRVAELRSDLVVARAMIARARDDHKAVFDALGADRPDEYVGNARWFAVALRADAHERMGDHVTALRTWRAAQRGYRNTVMLSSVAQTYGLAPSTRRRSIGKSWTALALLLVALGAMGGVLQTNPRTQLVSIGVMLVALVTALIVRRRAAG